MENHYGLLLIWLFPILGGIVAFALGKKNQSTRNDCIDIVMFAELIMLVCMGYQIAKHWSTLSLNLNNILGMGFSLSMDPVRLLLCTVVTLVFGVVGLFMKESLKAEKGSNRFYLLYMGLFGMVLGACMADSFFSLILFIIFAFLLAYPLMIHRPNPLALKNAGIYLAFSIVAILLFMSGLVMLSGYVGSVSYTGLYSMVLISGCSKEAFVGGMVTFAGFAICAGLFPVQFQVTRGNSYGLIETSAVLTCTVSKLGILGILLLGANMMGGSGIYGRTLLIMGIATAVWGICVTLTATDIRKILMGLDVAINGINVLAASLMVIVTESNGYAVRSSLYMLVISSLSLMTLYMAALEMLRKIDTYEIKGLIASGKQHKLLAAGCLLACASLVGVPGTAGFLAYSLLYTFILKTVGWKWLLAMFIILWAFFATAVVRVFMKFFVSKKDETLRILSTEAELSGKAKEQNGNESAGETDESAEESVKKTENPYRMGEIMLLIIGVVQVVIGVLPAQTVERISGAVNVYFRGGELSNAITYYTTDTWIAFGIVAVLCLLLYLNLVHGILLRVIRDKKNRKLQKENERQEETVPGDM